MDTMNDPRILMAEKCAKSLKNLLTGRGISKDVAPLVANVEKKILEMKYSYAEVNYLKEYFDHIKSLMRDIVSLLGGAEWSRKLKKYMDEEKIAHIKFCLNIIYNLDSRLRLKEDAAYAVDIRIGEIESIMNHPDADKLKICNVNVGKMITVITNIQELKVGDKIAVALLPPVKIRGVVSEGMFLSSHRKDGKVGDIPELVMEEINAARREVLNYLK